MTGLVFLILGGLIVLIMVLMLGLLRKLKERERRRETPLERGFATTGRVLGVFSLQFLVVLILFLVLDLEVVFVVALVFRGARGGLKRAVFILFVVGRLWAE